jgi:O-antigen ligase
MGRNNYVSLDFYLEHFETLNPEKSMPRVTRSSWRLNVWREAIEHWQATPVTIVVGEGFGRPLTSLRVAGLSIADSSQILQIAVRQPHNIQLTILARLGLVGFIIWIFIQARFVFLFVRSLRKKKKDSLEHALTLWLFLFFISGIIIASFQPWIEWPFGAIPFFIVSGFALAFISPCHEKTAEIEVKEVDEVCNSSLEH